MLPVGEAWRNRFAGFKSRWTMPCAWASAIVRATSRMIWQDLERDHPAAEQERVERAAVEELHDQERRAVFGAAEIEDVDDPRVADRAADLGLVEEAGERGRVAGDDVGAHHLDRDVASDGLVLCSPHGPHAAVPDEAKQPIP